jgi:hypothetical protein
VNMTRIAHRAARCALGGIPRHPVDNPSTCGSSLIAHESLSKQPEPPLTTHSRKAYGGSLGRLPGSRVMARIDSDNRRLPESGSLCK